MSVGDEAGRAMLSSELQVRDRPRRLPRDRVVPALELLRACRRIVLAAWRSAE